MNTKGAMCVDLTFTLPLTENKKLKFEMDLHPDLRPLGLSVAVRQAY